MKKRIAIVAIVVLEIIAVIGALPLFPQRFSYKDSVWEGSEMALPAFIALVTAGTIFYTRRESKIIRIVAPIALAGALILTIEVVKAFT